MNIKIIIYTIFTVLFGHTAHAADAGNEDHHVLNLAIGTYATFNLEHVPTSIHLNDQMKLVKAVIINTQQIHLPMELSAVKLLLETRGAILDEDEETIFLTGITIVQKKLTPFDQAVQEAMSIIENKILQLEAINPLLQDYTLQQQIIDEIESYKDFFIDQNRDSKK